MACVEGLGPAWKGLLNGGRKSETVQTMDAGYVTQRPHPLVRCLCAHMCLYRDGDGKQVGRGCRQPRHGESCSWNHLFLQSVGLIMELNLSRR